MNNQFETEKWALVVSGVVGGGVGGGGVELKIICAADPRPDWQGEMTATL